MIFDFKMEWCVDSTYISTNNELFDDFLRLYFYFDKDDFTMVAADVDFTIVHLGLSNGTVYTIAHSVSDHTHAVLGDSYRILLNNIRDNLYNDHHKYWERFTFRFSNIKPPPVVRSSTIYFEVKKSVGTEDIDNLDATFTFTPEPGAIFNTGFVLDNELCPLLRHNRQCRDARALLHAHQRAPSRLLAGDHLSPGSDLLEHWAHSLRPGIQHGSSGCGFGLHIV